MTRPRPSGFPSPSVTLEQDLERDPTHYFEAESRAARTTDLPGKELLDERLVDVVLSDMSAPWAQTEGFWIKSISNPYYRMMNTSGMPFRDHAGSMVCTPFPFVWIFLTRRAVKQSLTWRWIAGLVQCRTTVCIRYFTCRRSFCVQVLPRWRGQSTGATIKIAFCKSPPGEA